MKYNTLNVSGAGRERVSPAEKNLEEYRFLYWYTAFIRRKKSKSNLMVESQRQAQPSQLELGCAEAEEEIDNSENETTFQSVRSESEDTISPRDIERDPGKPTMCKRLGQSDVLKEISDFLRFKKSKSMPSNDVDDVFGRMVAAELKQLP